MPSSSAHSASSTTFLSYMRTPSRTFAVQVFVRTPKLEIIAKIIKDSGEVVATVLPFVATTIKDLMG